jgi:hypothetical protein
LAWAEVIVEIQLKTTLGWGGAGAEELETAYRVTAYRVIKSGTQNTEKENRMP